MEGTATQGHLASRRSFLRFLLASPLFGASLPLARALASGGSPEGALGAPIDSPGDAVSVFDFRAAAERALSPAHYAYLSLGTEYEATLAANRAAFDRYQLRPRRLVDVREVDTSRSVLGTRLASPIVLAPAGSQRAYHAEGELAVARAARRGNHLQVLSMGTSVPLEDVAAARGAPLWYQLYASRLWPVTRAAIRSAEQSGCSALVLTVDIVGLPSARDRILRYRRDENPECRSCHASLAGDALHGLERGARALGADPRAWIAESMMLDWTIVDRIRDATSRPLVIKGILTAEDARLCVEHGADAIVVSNHGGRAEDVNLAAIEVLPEVVAAVGGRIPVLVDSGFRRGTDFFKAFALGATAVCVGRPYLWGLAGFGQAGVEAVLALLRRELVTIMRQMGTPDLASIGPAHVRERIG